MARPRLPLGLVYDTGALIAAEANDRRMWALHARVARAGTDRTGRLRSEGVARRPPNQPCETV
ncbi:MAG: hypothetical protein LH616_09365 [Ilumatobacteraceae bacterium]|nr:hypothetical protein [Ilumatobacteraceae bacterium]